MDRAFDIRIDLSTLRKLYVKNKIGFRTVSYQYQQYANRPKEPLWDFAVKLSRLLAEGKMVVYFDEASFHNWMRPDRTWCRADRPVKMII